MIIDGAVIREQGVVFAIVVVKPRVTQYTATIVEAQRQYAAIFPNMPIILMSQNEQGDPRYVGRKDIVNFLKTVKLEQIPWKQYRVY